MSKKFVSLETVLPGVVFLFFAVMWSSENTIYAVGRVGFASYASNFGHKNKLGVLPWYASHYNVGDIERARKFDPQFRSDFETKLTDFIKSIKKEATPAHRARLTHMIEKRLDLAQNSAERARLAYIFGEVLLENTQKLGMNDEAHALFKRVKANGVNPIFVMLAQKRLADYNFTRENPALQYDESDTAEQKASKDRARLAASLKGMIELGMQGDKEARSMVETYVNHTIYPMDGREFNIALNYDETTIQNLLKKIHTLKAQAGVEGPGHISGRYADTSVHTIVDMLLQIKDLEAQVHSKKAAEQRDKNTESRQQPGKLPMVFVNASAAK